MQSIFKRLKAIDAFPKIQDDFYSKTMSGGVITIVCALLMLVLFFTELGLYLTTKSVHMLEVDTSRGERININLDITFPRMPCDWISVDAIDSSGRVQTKVDHDLKRQRLSAKGRRIQAQAKHEVSGGEELPDRLHPDTPKLPDDYCGSCYGADSKEGACCNSCADVREAYQTKGWVMPSYDTIEQCKREGFQDSLLRVKHEGCQLRGTVQVAKVAGRIQFAAGKTYEHAGQLVHDLQALKDQTFDVSHSITSMTFGDGTYPGQINPLSGASFDQRKDATNPQSHPGMYQYYLKVVPTSYKASGKVTESMQYSATDHFQPLDQNSMARGGVPSISFYYDLSAVKVNVVEKATPFLHFITNVCAIVGGVWALSGLVDSTVYHSQRLIKKKIDIGKYG
eukprot:jgi/Ulvmu1/8233/UM041_0043.1